MAQQFESLEAMLSVYAFKDLGCNKSFSRWKEDLQQPLSRLRLNGSAKYCESSHDFERTLEWFKAKAFYFAVPLFLFLNIQLFEAKTLMHETHKFYALSAHGTIRIAVACA